MAEDRRLDVLAKLIVKLGELRAQETEILEEVDRLLKGHAGIGELLKRLYAHFDRVWSVRYSSGQTKYYVWSYAKDASQMKRLIKMLGVEEVERRMIAYLKNDDPFYTKARHSFGLFVASINSHTAESPETATADLELNDDVAATRRRREAMRS
jgi:hypothetical protein